MEPDQALMVLLQVSGLLFVVGSILAMGLGLTLPAILSSLRDRRLLGPVLLANFVLVPAVAWAPRSSFAATGEFRRRADRADVHVDAIPDDAGRIAQHP